MAPHKLYLAVLVAFELSASTVSIVANAKSRNRSRTILSSLNNSGECVVSSGIASIVVLTEDATKAAWLVSTPPTDTLLADPLQLCKFLLAAFIATAVAAVAQGAFATIRYRRNFGDAPAPRVPSHGVVVVRSRSERNSEIAIANASDCLNLLVIGDSLAVGVGQLNTAYPVLPEEIAKELSKSLRKPVFWTCCGESGASTQWIIRMLEQPDVVDVDPDHIGQLGLAEVIEEVAHYDDDADILQQTWRKKLDRYREFCNPENLRPYDVVVLVTGPNDLKSVFLPFILDEEDRQLRQQKHGGKRDGGFIGDIRLFIRTLNEKMENRVQKFRQGLQMQLEKTLQDLRESMDEFARILNVNMDDVFDQLVGPPGVVENLLDGIEEDLMKENASFSTLYVLPAVPVRALPSLQEMIPLRWLAGPIFDAMDRKKKLFASSNPDSVLFVDGLPFSTMLEFEENRGQLWEASNDGAVILASRDIGPRQRNPSGRCHERELQY